MKKFNRRALSLFVTAGLIALLSFMSVSADPVMDKKSQNFREQLGLSVEATVISKASQESVENNSKEIFGVELTDLEMDELLTRENLAAEAAGIKALNISNYAGRYINTKTGELIIGLTSIDEDSKQKILNIFTEKDRVKFIKANHTESELDGKLELFNQYLKGLSPQESIDLGFVSAGISPELNKIKVVVSEKTSVEEVQLITNLIGENYVVVETGEIHEPKAARTDRFRPVIAGVKLERDDFGTNAFCTSGFSVQDNSGNKGLITAGHCFTLDQTVWQPEVQQFSTDNSLGKPSTRSYGGNSDSAYIRYSDVSPYIFISDPVKGEIYSEFDVTVGQLLAYEGLISDLMYGDINCTSCTVGYADGTRLYNQIKADVSIQGGDSGAPAFVVPTVNNIIAVGLAVSGNSYEIGVSPIYHIKTDLGLSHVLTAP
jgi:hypothetical protein